MKDDDFTLSEEAKRELLKLARSSIETYYISGARIEPKPFESALNEERGVFVTLHKKGALRGCLGNFTPDLPLYKMVPQMAISSATQDPRFPPVMQSELKDIDIEISVLSPLRKIKDVSKIEVGKHGIYIIKGYFRGTLLPQVATEYGWDRETFLENSCLKAGLPKDAWKEGADIYIYSAQVFGEKDIGLQGA